MGCRTHADLAPTSGAIARGGRRKIIKLAEVCSPSNFKRLYPGHKGPGLTLRPGLRIIAQPSRRCLSPGAAAFVFALVQRLSCGSCETRLGCGVQTYRLCKVAEDGQRIEFEELVCRDDGHAVHLAKRRVQDHDIEVWAGVRFVFRLECKRR
jgi:hypothetical protein